jgi:hypothetical protein
VTTSPGSPARPRPRALSTVASTSMRKPTSPGMSTYSSPSKVKLTGSVSRASTVDDSASRTSVSVIPDTSMPAMEVFGRTWPRWTNHSAPSAMMSTSTTPPTDQPTMAVRRETSGLRAMERDPSTCGPEWRPRAEGTNGRSVGRCSAHAREALGGRSAPARHPVRSRPPCSSVGIARGRGAGSSTALTRLVGGRSCSTSPGSARAW